MTKRRKPKPVTSGGKHRKGKLSKKLWARRFGEHILNGKWL